MPWLGKVAIAGIAGGMGVLGQDVARSPGDWYAKIAPIQVYLRVPGEATDKIEMSPDAISRLDRLIREFGSQIDGELKKPWEIQQGFRAWVLAQTTLAVHGLHEIDRPKLVQTLTGLAETECGCWHEYPQTPPHVPATSWVIYSLGQTGSLPGSLTPEFLLKTQKLDGWWPLHPSTDSASNASAYATSWAVLALSVYAANKKAELERDKEKATRIDTAILRGIAWLKRNKLDQVPRWQDYPLSSDSFRSLSISGLVLFTLHKNPRRDDLETIDRAWLNALDGSMLESDDIEQSDGTVTFPSGPPINDRTRHIKLPWVVLGTTAAYKNGTAWQRAKALAWFERLVGSELLTRSVRNKPWVAAELLIALKELKRRASS